jgi:uncharacterized protein (TIGR02444 family)
MTWPTCPFWDYSLKLYGSPGVEAACLDLQRRHGLDVNLVLWACWLASLGIELDEATFERGSKAVSSWQAEVVRPLRALRRRLGARVDRAKPESVVALWPEQAKQLRQDVLAVELDGEHLAQLALSHLSEGLSPSRPKGLDLGCANLMRIRHFRSDDRDALRALLRQAYPAAASEQLASALRSITIS